MEKSYICNGFSSQNVVAKRLSSADREQVTRKDAPASETPAGDDDTLTPERSGVTLELRQYHV